MANGRRRLLLFRASVLFLHILVFNRRIIYSANQDGTKVACPSTSTCAKDAPLYATIIFPFTTVTNISTCCIYGGGAPSPCRLKTSSSLEGAPCLLSLVANFLPSHHYSVSLLFFLLRTRPDDATARQVRCVSALHGSCTTLVTDSRPISIPPSRATSVSESSPSSPSYWLPVFGFLPHFSFSLFPFPQWDCGDHCYIFLLF